MGIGAGGGKGTGGQALSQLASQGRGAGAPPGGQAAFARPYQQAMQQRMAQARPAAMQARAQMPPRPMAPQAAQLQQAYQQFAAGRPPPPMPGGKGGPGAPIQAGKGGPGGMMPGGQPVGGPPGLGGLAGLWFNQQRTPPPAAAPDPMAAANTPAAITNAFGSTVSGAAPVTPTEPMAPAPEVPAYAGAPNSLYRGGIVSLANGGAVWEPASRGGVTLAPATPAPVAPAPVAPAAPIAATPAATVSWKPGAAATTGNTGSMFNNINVAAIKTPEKFVAGPKQTIWQPPAKVEDTSSKNKGISKFDMFIGGMGAGGQKYLQQKYAKDPNYRPTDLQRMQMMNKGGSGLYAQNRGGSK